MQDLSVNEYERTLALKGDRIGAIRAYRNRVGGFMAEAKRAIDAAVPPEQRPNGVHGVETPITIRTASDYREIRAELWARVYSNEFARASRRTSEPDSRYSARLAAYAATEDFDAYLERSKP